MIELVSACRPLSHPPIKDLLIDLSAFPDGWSGDTNGPGPMARAPLWGKKSVESIEIFFYVYGSGAYEGIQRFLDTQSAAEEFSRQLGIVFIETEFDTPWVIPDELNFESFSASRSYYACSQSEGIPWQECAYIAQYGTYFVHFNTGMVPGYMSLDDFERVLQAIDDKMAKYADKDCLVK